jgi:tetratricopeptide (TPR) repeat protein
MRRLLPVLVLLASALPLPLLAQEPAEENQLDTDIRMFTVMAAINVAGYDDGVDTRGDSPVRQAVRRRLESFDGPSKKLLETAYQEFRLRDPAENLSQFVTYALLCQGPPTFDLYADLPTDLPPDVRPIRSFGPILQQFYQEADIESLWLEYQPAYEEELARYQAALTPMLIRTAGYLRIGPQSREFQAFKVWIDLMGTPNALNTRLYGGNVQVVAHPSDRIQLNEIRHAFLMHLLDRLSIRNREVVAGKQVLSRFALFAPALDDAYKEDFELLVTKSLVKAVEARLDHADAEAAKPVVEQALREGYILAPYFYDALGKYEEDTQIMNNFYAEMIEGIDVKREAGRLQNVKFAEPAEISPSRPMEPRRVQLSLLDKKLQQAEFLFREEMFEEAQQAFLAAIELTGGRNAQAEYGLGRVAAQEGEAELAIEHFLVAANLAVDEPHIRAMSHIYVARISDIMGERDAAIEHYNQARQVGDPAPRTQELIAEGLNQQFQSPRQLSEEAEDEDPEDDPDAEPKDESVRAPAPLPLN